MAAPISSFFQAFTKSDAAPSGSSSSKIPTSTVSISPSPFTADADNAGNITILSHVFHAVCNLARLIEAKKPIRRHHKNSRIDSPVLFHKSHISLAVVDLIGESRTAPLIRNFVNIETLRIADLAILQNCILSEIVVNKLACFFSVTKIAFIRKVTDFILLSREF